MTNGTRLKTFVHPNHKALEAEFNNWSEAADRPISIIDTSMVYSSSLQKFVFSVVYTVGSITKPYSGVAGLEYNKT